MSMNLQEAFSQKGYVLGPRLGLGATSVVYAARDSLGQDLALKVLHEEHCGHTELVMRFFNEAEAAALVHHPAVIRIFDHGYLREGLPYLAQEALGPSYVECPLGRTRDLLGALASIADGLSALHQAGVIHRDVKPEHLLWGKEGGLRLVDLGLAKILGITHKERMLQVSTQTTDILGTPEYRAPEVWMNPKHVTKAVDVYSLGVVLYELLTGHLPFEADRESQLMDLHLHEKAPSLEGFSAALGGLVSSMLEKKPRNRPSMDQVAQLLNRCSMGSTGESVGR